MDTKDIYNVLPQNIKEMLVNSSDINKLQELRIKIDKPVIFVSNNKEYIGKYKATTEDLKILIQRISNYSVYAFEEEIKQGYITIKGGHRVGICGKCVLENNTIKTIKNISSINLRICREVIGCSNTLMKYLLDEQQILNSIIISPPKCGKTTLLRDIARNISNGMDYIDFSGRKVCVIDERSELAACFEGIPQMDVGLRTDVLDGCMKSEGIMMAIRSMSPEVIICDEIGAYKDMESIIAALNSGINLITSIHGFGVEDIYERKVFKDVIDNNVFSRAIVLSTRKGICTVDYIYDFKEKNYVWRNAI
jgi:stage III sporulation protein AA